MSAKWSNEPLTGVLVVSGEIESREASRRGDREVHVLIDLAHATPNRERAGIGGTRRRSGVRGSCRRCHLDVARGVEAGCRVDRFTVTGLDPVLVTLNVLVRRVARILDHVDLSRVYKKSSSGHLGRAQIVSSITSDRLGLIHRCEDVQESGSLLGRGCTDIGRRAHEDLFHQRRSGVVAIVRRRVGGDDVSGSAGGQRGRLTRTAGELDG